MGALIFTFSGFSILHFMHLNALGVVSQLPWLLLACDVLMCAKDLRHIAAARLAIAVLTGLQHLAGYSQFVIFSLIAEGAGTAVAGVGWRQLASDSPLCAGDCLGLCHRSGPATAVVGRSHALGARRLRWNFAPGSLCIR